MGHHSKISEGARAFLIDPDEKKMAVEDWKKATAYGEKGSPNCPPHLHPYAYDIHRMEVGLGSCTINKLHGESFIEHVIPKLMAKKIKA